jgi:tRNA 2-thiouridine synthesizing protein A
MTEVALSLDCLGKKCPAPIIELARRIGEVEFGELVEVFADDPAAEPDLAAWCRMREQELVVADAPRFVVRRRSR